MDTSRVKLSKSLTVVRRATENLLAELDSREIVLWIRSLPKDPPNHSTLVSFVGLPWRAVISEIFDPQLTKALESEAIVGEPMVRKRGFVQFVDGDPSRVELPPRCLPIYLLNGRSGGAATPADFEGRLRKMTMLEAVRRSAPREILVISTVGVDPIPPDLSDLWSSGFRSYLTFTTEAANADSVLEAWLSSIPGAASATLWSIPASEAIEEILRGYARTYPEGRRFIRLRGIRGRYHTVDITESDEPERPTLDQYSVIEERHLVQLTPEELSESDFVAFFQDASQSWRPYQAGLPWTRDPTYRTRLAGFLKKLDSAGPEENNITYIASESGAGGTTLARALAWECARQGYPVLLAKQLPFLPDALPVSNFLKRVHDAAEAQTGSDLESSGAAGNPERDSSGRLYETPWVIVFDTIHWQYRDDELIRFRNEMEKAGRPVCLLVVTGPVAGILSRNDARFAKLAELTHAIDLNEALQLGSHLNQFLRFYGKQREPWQWETFYREHTVRYLEGIAAFWVTLSFWIQGQYDLSESVQEWMYRSFLSNAKDRLLKEAVLAIAALSSERLPLPEGLLPKSKGEWPTSLILADRRSNFAALGLTRLSSDGDHYWALVHDILGRFLINAVYYDFGTRKDLGYEAARDPENLRYLLLRQISKQPELGQVEYRSIGEDFATSVFKIDPDHGHAAFVSMWRDVLDALDEMPRPLRDTSRLFRHHTAISRRRIAKLDEAAYGVTPDERISLLSRAIEDINYALNSIDYTPGSESNLNLLNSLANAYFDLADAESVSGASRGRIEELRALANDATRRAYAENPTNSFVIETYVKNLLQTAKISTTEGPTLCVEALGILFSALAANEVGYRAARLGGLADRALKLLFQQVPTPAPEGLPTSPIEVLVQAWGALSTGDHSPSMALSELPEANRIHALEVLSHPAGRGNMQVLRLRYDLTSVTSPYAFRQQLEFVEQLQATDYRMTPQLRLEYAVLLYQNSRPLEGDKVFHVLRSIWHQSEHSVQVPERLRWLRGPEGKSLQVVHATVSFDYGSRAMARVQEFASVTVPFRPEEHGFRHLRVGIRFSCHVSFGPNGPFLRPVTVGSGESHGGARGY